MVGAVEIELDKTTGKVDIIDYVGVLDCGTPINPNLVRIQAEGGIAQGIGMALWEDVKFDSSGKLLTDNFMSYKIPSRLDIKNVRIAIAPTYEPTGPFG
ncbi:molybdopterin cofactor-binding domain-containing protein, partial [Arthrospira platensis SPKY1]|nr:molybdopterin cofactor-binding domain-containing protein [Arthrospira platensis SPKY1]